MSCLPRPQHRRQHRGSTDASNTNGSKQRRRRAPQPNGDGWRAAAAAHQSDTRPPGQKARPNTKASPCAGAAAGGVGRAARGAEGSSSCGGSPASRRWAAAGRDRRCPACPTIPRPCRPPSFGRGRRPGSRRAPAAPPALSGPWRAGCAECGGEKGGCKNGRRLLPCWAGSHCLQPFAAGCGHSLQPRPLLRSEGGRAPPPGRCQLWTQQEASRPSAGPRRECHWQDSIPAGAAAADPPPPPARPAFQPPPRPCSPSPP